MEQPIPSKRHILLVEDESIIALSEKRVLRNHGYDVSIAGSGEKALAAVEADPTIDLVLMDIDLGDGIDGTEAARRILEIHSLPVVFLTGHSEREMVAKVKGITRYGYVLKSSGEFVLLETIGTAFELFEAHERVTAREQRYRALFDGTPASVAIYDSEARFVDVNRVSQRNIGLPREEIQGRSLRELVPDKYELALQRISECLETMAPIEATTKAEIPVGGVRYFRSVLVPIDLGDNAGPYVQIVSFDVTAEEEAQQALREQEAQYRRIVENMTDFVTVIDGAGTTVFASENAERLLGYTADELIGSDAFTYVHPEDREELLASFADIMQLRQSSHAKARFIRKDGSELWMEGHGKYTTDTDGKPQIVVVLRDISDRVSADKRFEAAFHRAPTIMSLTTIDGGVYLNVNRAFEEAFGFSTEEVLEKSAVDLGLIAAEDGAKIVSDIKRNGRVEDIPLTFTARDGTPLTCRYYGEIIELEGEQCLLSLARDETRERVISNELNEMEETLRTIFEASSVGIQVVASDDRITHANPALCSMLGYSESELLSLKSADITDPDDRRREVATIANPADRTSATYQKRFLRRDGASLWCHVNAHILRNDDSSVNRIIAIVEAVSDYRRGGQDDGKAAQLTLGRPAERPADDHYLKAELYDLIRSDPAVFDFLEAGSLDGIWYWDLERPEHEWMSRRFWEVLGHDPDTKRHDPAEWQDLIYEEDLQVAYENLQRHLQDPSHPYDQIVRYKAADGNTVWVRCRGIAIRDGDGNPMRVLGAHNEITQLKETEERLRDLVNEKTSIVEEVHHRVKNNLAAVSALVDLKNLSLGSSVDLSDISAHIGAIRFVYEHLSNRRAAEEVDLAEYVERLVASVFHASSDVQTILEVPRTPVTAKTAMTVGQILNELAMNAMKHGFEEGKPKVFRVRYSQEPDGGAVFSVSNTGRPVPADVEPGSGSTLGLGLVQALVSQLGGSMEIEHQEARFIIRLPAEAQHRARRDAAGPSSAR